MAAALDGQVMTSLLRPKAESRTGQFKQIQHKTQLIYSKRE